MKQFKKLTALLLAVVMVLSLSIAAFARDGGTIDSATINGEDADIVTIDGVNYVRKQLTDTSSGYSLSEYSLRNAVIVIDASDEPEATGVTFGMNDDGEYVATGVDLFNKCLDVTVDGTVYRFAAGLKSGIVAIDNNDPLKVTFSYGETAFTNRAVNVQNPNIGNSGYDDGWTGIAYSASITVDDASADLSALEVNVTKASGTTLSGSCITENSDGTYTLNMSAADRAITVTNGSMSRDIYMAVTKSGEPISVSIRFNTDHASSSTQAESLQSKMRAASVGGTGTLYVTLSDSKTVMDALLAASSTAGFTVTYTGSTYGAYVTGIEGLNAGGAAGWMYKVNGVMPMTGAGNYTLQNGDTIVWGFVTSFNDTFE